MRRYVLLILFGVVLITPFVLRLAVTRGRETVKADGPSAGRLVIVTPHNQDIRREMGIAFNEWHLERFGSSVELDYRTPGGTNDIKRLLVTTYRPFVTPDGAISPNVPVDIDIIWGGGDYFFDVELKRAFEVNGKSVSVLQPMSFVPQILRDAFPSDRLAGVKLYDVAKDAAGNPLPPQWVGTCLSAFGIVYNPDLYATLGLSAPAGWPDLTHEKLAGLVALADPTHSGSAAVAYLMVIQRAMADGEEAYLARHPERKGLPYDKLAADPEYQRAIADGWKRGMGQLLLMAANARYFTDSASQVPNDVGNGEAAAGVAIDFYGRVYEERVGAQRIRFVSPPAATAITPDPIGILHGVSGQRQVLANRFIEFLLSPRAQRLWILKVGEPGGPRQRNLRRTPIRRDIYADQTGWADKVNPFEEAGGFNQRGQWMVLFADTRPLWAAAWIDGREELKSAHRAISKVSDPTRRAELLARLADLPLDMQTVARLRDERRQIEATGVSSDEWKARRRIEWGRTFRQHYERVAEEAHAGGT